MPESRLRLLTRLREFRREMNPVDYLETEMRQNLRAIEDALRGDEIVAAVYNGTPEIDLLGSTYAPISFPNKVTDTHNIVRDKKIIIPFDGLYSFDCQAEYTATFATKDRGWLSLFINEEETYTKWRRSVGSDVEMIVHLSLTFIPLRKGDVCEVKLRTEGSGAAFSESTYLNYFNLGMNKRGLT